jgi:hypothetical protein
MTGKNSHYTQEIAVLGHCQTLIGRPSANQWQAATLREAKGGRVEKHGLFVWGV